jgi:hypothetical protein
MGGGGESAGVQPSWGSRLKRGLFTHEDTFNVHKILGLPCLLHFIVRTLSVPVAPMSDMGFDASTGTLFIILWHLSLSVSSLVFRIPKVRIKEGSRIWPEFRLHSIVFACRSLACMSLVWIEQRYDPHGEPRYWANVAIVFATLVCADAATSSVDPSSRSNTIRGLETSAAYKFAFSFMQFLGTCGCLVGLRAYAAQFAIVFIIQVYAFTLTLRRKNLVSHRATVFIYAYQLTVRVAPSAVPLPRRLTQGRSPFAMERREPPPRHTSSDPSLPSSLSLLCTPRRFAPSLEALSRR